MSNIEISDMLE